MNLFQAIKAYEIGWTEIEVQKGFCEEECAQIERAEVVNSSYGLSLQLTCTDHKYRYIPMDEFSTYQLGDVVDPREICLVTLQKDDITIFRAR